MSALTEEHEERDAQEQADLLCGLLLISDLVERGMLEQTGPFTVNVPETYAVLALLAADETVSKPSRETMVREAIYMMGVEDALAQEDYEAMTFLLAHEATLEWPGR